VRKFYAVAAVIFTTACGKPEPSEVHHTIGSDGHVDAPGASTASASAPPAAHTITADEEVRAVVQLLWPAARKVTEIDWTWAGCHDKTVGFDESRACLQKALTDAEAVALALPKAPLKVTSSCGKEVEAAHRAQIQGKIDYFRDETAWMDKHATKLRPRMKTQSVWNASDDDNGRPAIDGAPLNGDDKYTGMGLMHITAVSCLRALYGCTGDVCVQTHANAQTGLSGN
jgi:hypothetical protein